MLAVPHLESNPTAQEVAATSGQPSGDPLALSLDKQTHHKLQHQRHHDRQALRPQCPSPRTLFHMIPLSPVIIRVLLVGALLTVIIVAFATPLQHVHVVATRDAAAGAAQRLRAAGVVAFLDALPPPLQRAISDTGFVAAFSQSLLLILACEVGDRTFFVAAILAMKSSRWIVFLGAISALALMTVLSALIGKAFPMLIDKKYTSVAASILFAYFGVQLLRDWWNMRNQHDVRKDELAEVEEELSGNGNRTPRKNMLPSSLAASPVAAVLSPVFIKAFSMTVLAEWGDRSQIATIALAAAQNIYGVIIGGVLGHAICTSLAVIGGRLLAAKISEKAVAFVGGVLFMIFAGLTLAGKME